MEYIVFHTIRAGTKTVRTAKFVVTDVPDKTSATAVMNLLETAGKAVDFAEAGVPWGNHEVKSSKQLPTDATGVDEAPRASWDALQDTRDVKRVTLRFAPQDYAKFVQSAKRASLSLQKWCESRLLTAAKAETPEE